jgi:hypothetical protein
MIELRLLGPVFAYLLETGGRLALHGSAVVVDGQAVAFLSENHGGKTSMAATWLQAGAELLTDDLLALAVGDDGDLTAFPAYPQMRMWPTEARHFWGSVDDLAPVQPGIDKRRVPVGAPGFASFHRGTAPLAAVYVLERVDHDGFHAELAPERGAHALMMLARHCFIQHSAAELGLLAPRLERFAQVLAAVPVRRLRFKADLSELRRVADVIESDLRTIGA